MATTSAHIDSEQKREEWLGMFQRASLPFTASFCNDAKRSLNQNALLHKWFGEIAKHHGMTATEAKGMCHRAFGLSIRMREKGFAWVWERSGARLPYESQCKLLASGVLNVSSGMSVKELTEYMDAISSHYRAQGVALTTPELA